MSACSEVKSDFPRGCLGLAEREEGGKWQGAVNMVVEGVRM